MRSGNNVEDGTHDELHLAPEVRLSERTIVTHWQAYGLVVMTSTLLHDLLANAHFVLGDTHYNDPALRHLCAEADRILVTTRRGSYPHTDSGVEVRRIFYKLRSTAIENFNGQFKGIFDAHGQVPTKGLANPRRFALGAIFLYQLALLYRYETQLVPGLSSRPCRGNHFKTGATA
jgi:hypothetical protein